MINKKNILLVIPFLIIINISGCYNKNSEKISEISPTQTIAINTKSPLSTPSEIPLQSNPTISPISTSTPVHTASYTKAKPVTTKNGKSSPKKINNEASKITPTPLYTPSITNKTPVITCDGDVCRIIID